MEIHGNKVDHDYDTFFYPSVCHVCKRFGDGFRLKKCGGCKMIAYCGPQHQKQHWPDHRSLCKAIQIMKPIYQRTEIHRDRDEEDKRKMYFMLLSSFKMRRFPKPYEKEMLIFRRECAICYEWKCPLLEDCRRCALSYCKDHCKDSVEHWALCDPMELCFRTNLSFIGSSEKNDSVDLPPYLPYLQYISEKLMNCFATMDDFVKFYLVKYDRSNSEISYDISASRHAEYLTHPLTLFHAIRLLDYVPKESLVIHVLCMGPIKEVDFGSWEVLLHTLDNVKSLTIVMVGSTVNGNSKSNLILCDKCTLRGKNCSLEFQNELYSIYVSSELYTKPDLIVAYHAGIYDCELVPFYNDWTLHINLIASQKCPFIITSYTQCEIKDSVDEINKLIDTKVPCVYNGENPFASLRPHRCKGSVKVFYQNRYVIIYRNLFPYLQTKNR